MSTKALRASLPELTRTDGTTTTVQYWGDAAAPMALVKDKTWPYREELRPATPRALGLPSGGVSYLWVIPTDAREYVLAALPRSDPTRLIEVPTVSDGSVMRVA